MKSLVDQFSAARKDFLESLKKFPKDKVDEILFGKWNLKDVIAHFSAWNIYFTNALKLLKKGKAVEHWGNIDNFNTVEVKKRKGLSWQKIYNEFVKSGKDFINEYQYVPDNIKNKLFWQNRKYTPEKFLKVNIHHYQKAQLQEIKKLLNKN